MRTIDYTSSHKKFSGEKSSAPTIKASKIHRPAYGSKLSFNTKRDGTYNYLSSNKKKSKRESSGSKDLLENTKVEFGGAGRKRDPKNGVKLSQTRDSSVKSRI